MKITARAALAFLALSLAGAAHAGGDYYEGVQKDSAGIHQSASKGEGKVSTAVVGSGDYYEGAVRPN